MDDPLDIVNTAIDEHRKMVKQMKGVPDMHYSAKSYKTRTAYYSAQTKRRSMTKHCNLLKRIHPLEVIHAYASGNRGGSVPLRYDRVQM